MSLTANDCKMMAIAGALLGGPLLAMIAALSTFRNSGQGIVVLIMGLTMLYYLVYWALAKIFVEEG